MMNHQELIGLIIAYTFVGAIVFTVVITCFSLVGWIRFSDPSQQKKLFSILIVELMVVAIGWFAGFIQLSPQEAARGIESAAIESGQEKNLILENLSNVEPSILAQVARRLDLSDEDDLRGLIENAETVAELDRIKNALDQTGVAISLPSRRLIVGTWNVDQLGNSQGDADRRTPDELARHIALGGASVFAFPEVNVTHIEEGGRRNRLLDLTFQFLNEDIDQDWQYVLLPKRRDGDRRQLIGVAWNNARVSLVRDPKRLDVKYEVDGFALWNRALHALQFSAGQGRTDFTVIPIHMKSNYGGQTAAADRRALEAQELVSQLPALRRDFGDDDIIILGDANIFNHSEKAISILEGSGQFRDLNSADQITWYSERLGGLPLDRIFVPPQPEFASSRQYTLVPSATEEHDERLSDHFIVLTQLDVTRDDD